MIVPEVGMELKDLKDMFDFHKNMPMPLVSNEDMDTFVWLVMT